MSPISAQTVAQTLGKLKKIARRAAATADRIWPRSHRVTTTNNGRRNPRGGEKP